MKTKFLLLGAVATLISLASCSTSSKSKCSDEDSCAVAEKVYSGVIPAADAAGIRYTVTLTNDSTSEGGSYNLVETFLKSDGVNDSTEVKTTGVFAVENKDGKTYLKLTPAAADSTAQALYFFVASDSTIVLVNSDLQESANPELNYTLNLNK